MTRIVLFRLADRHALAELVELRTDGSADLRTYSVHADRSVDVLEIHNARQGTGEHEWQDIEIDQQVELVLCELGLTSSLPLPLQQ